MGLCDSWGNLVLMDPWQRYLFPAQVMPKPQQQCLHVEACVTRCEQIIADCKFVKQGMGHNISVTLLGLAASHSADVC